MKTYTKDQLIRAMTQYYREAIHNPELFVDYKTQPAETSASQTINYLLSLIP